MTLLQKEFAPTELEPSVRHHLSAERALLSYTELAETERTDFEAHARRVTDIVRVFADDLVASRTYDTVLLHDVADRAFDSSDLARKNAALGALADYFTDPTLSEESALFTSCLLGDMAVVEDAAERYRKQLGTDADSDVLEQVLTANYRGKLPVELWSMKAPVIDISHLKEVCEATNIESIIIKAAEALDNIANPPSNEASVLQDILEVETFHAPLCEVLGLDAMAMKLRSEAKKQRLVRGGNGKLVEDAEAVNRVAREFDIHGALRQIFNEDLTETIYEANDTSSHPEPVVCSVMQLPEGTLHLRIKTIGSLADKLRRDPQLPMDILGTTVVMNDASDVGNYFGSMLCHLSSLPGVELHPAPSKEAAAYIQGSGEYVNQVLCELQQYQSLPNVQIRQQEGIYQVCKCTFMVEHQGQVLPVEMQFMTNDDRRNARVGRTAHILFKQQHEAGRDDVNLDELTEFLQTIYSRKHDMDNAGAAVNKKSIPHGTRLLDEIELYVETSSN